jgi:hypothetical protein
VNHTPGRLQSPGKVTISVSSSPARDLEQAKER